MGRIKISGGIRINLISFGAIAIAALIPSFLGGNTYLMLVLCLCGIYIIAASGLDLLFGYSGQISMGHAAFYALGAYGSAILSKTVGINPWLSMLIAAGIAAVVATLFAIPTTKLVMMFLSLVTTGLGELVYQSLVNFFPEVTGSTQGFRGIPRLMIGAFVIRKRADYFYVVLLFVVVFLFLKRRVVESRIGRAFVAIKENAVAAGAMGIHVRYYKTMAFAISAFFTAYAGALYAHLVGFISPESFTRPQSVLFLTMVLFGGMGTFFGPIIGAIILIFVNESIQVFGNVQLLFYGLFIIAVILFMPQGIAGGVKTLVSRMRSSKAA